MPRGLDLYLAAMGRSGSTLLCDLYSHYPSRWLMSEPWIVRGAYGVALRQRASTLGFDIPDKDWYAKIAGEAPLDRFWRVYGEIVGSLEFFGAKEVRCEFHEEYYRLMHPRKVLILVRDIRDVIISLIEKAEIENKEGYDLAFVSQYLRDNCRGLIEFYNAVTGGEVEVLKYEEFSTSEERRKQIDRFIGHGRIESIPETGSNVSIRPWEIERHGLTVSDKSVNRYRRESNINWVDFYNEIADCKHFNEFYEFE